MKIKEAFSNFIFQFSSIKLNDEDSEKFRIILKIFHTGQISETFKALFRQFPELLKAEVLIMATKIIALELKQLCSAKSQSSFKLENVATATQFSYDQQLSDLKEKAPFLFKVMKTIGINPRNKRCKKKSDETCIPGIMMAVSTLLFTRNRLMNSGAVINTLILRRGEAKKITFDRFNKIGLCTSYSSVLNKMMELGKNFDQELLSKMRSMEIECAEFKEEVTKQLVSPMDIPIVHTCLPPPVVHTCALPPVSDCSFKFMELSIHREILVLQLFKLKFMLIGDNVDVSIKRRHYGINRINTDLHLFNTIAVSFSQDFNFAHSPNLNYSKQDKITISIDRLYIAVYFDKN